jgi:antirestriction protein ArdC
MTTATQPSTLELNWPELLNTVLTLPGDVGSLSAIYCRFYNYSYLNQLLMYIQDLHEPVATYKRWLEIGRQVRKGSKARQILRPITVSRKDSDGNKSTDPNDTFTRFKMVNCIFPLSDTDGDDVELPELPAWSVTAAALALNITREGFAMLDGNTQGYSHGTTYAVNPVAVHPLKTAVHELAHIVLGHTTGNEYSTHRGIFEFQAESVAYIVNSEVAPAETWSPATSRAYVQQWLGGTEVTDAHIKPIFTAANKILTAGRS